MKRKSNFISSVISTVSSWLNPFKSMYARLEAKSEDGHDEDIEKILAEYEAMNVVLASQLSEAEQVLRNLQSQSVNPVLSKPKTSAQPTIQMPLSSILYSSEKEKQIKQEEEISRDREELASVTLVAAAACQSLEEVKMEAHKYLLVNTTEVKHKKANR